MNSAKQILEQNNLAQTHWGQRIITAEEAGEFTEKDKVAASDWTTCACGRLDDGIPRDLRGYPEDERLRILGCEFYLQVWLPNFSQAAETLAAIEKRAIEVLTELTKEHTL